MAINDSVWGIPDGPDMTAYNANHELVKISLTRNVSFQKEHTHEAKTPIKIPPECTKDNTPCSLEKRKAISNAIRTARESNLTRSPSKSPVGTQGTGQNPGDYVEASGDRQGTASLFNVTVREESREEGSALPPGAQSPYTYTLNDDIIRSGSHLPGHPSTQALLIKQVQEKAKRGIKSLDFRKLTARHPNSIMQQQREAIPSDKRFEPIKGNMELLTKHRNTKNAPNLKMAPRTELWKHQTAQAP